MGIKIRGAKELQERLLALPDKIAKSIMGRALRAGAEPVLAQAIANCPVKTGNLVAQLNISTSQRGGDTSAFVGVGEAYYAIMFEKGSTGPGKRIQPPRKFLEDALEQAAEEATKIIAEELKVMIEDAAKP